MDWFKGKFTGKHHIWWENPWFPVDFPLNQSIDHGLFMEFSWVFLEQSLSESWEKQPKLSGHCRRWGFALQPDVGETCGTNFQAGTWQLKWYRVCFLHAVCYDYDHPYLVGGIIVGIVVPNIWKVTKNVPNHQPDIIPFTNHFGVILNHCFPTACCGHGKNCRAETRCLAGRAAPPADAAVHM